MDWAVSPLIHNLNLITIVAHQNIIDEKQLKFELTTKMKVLRNSDSRSRTNGELMASLRRLSPILWNFFTDSLFYQVYDSGNM